MEVQIHDTRPTMTFGDLEDGDAFLIADMVRQGLYVKVAVSDLRDYDNDEPVRWNAVCVGKLSGGSFRHAWFNISRLVTPVSVLVAKLS